MTKHKTALEKVDMVLDVFKQHWNEDEPALTIASIVKESKLSHVDVVQVLDIMTKLNAGYWGDNEHKTYAVWKETVHPTSDPKV